MIRVAAAIILNRSTDGIGDIAEVTQQFNHRLTRKLIVSFESGVKFCDVSGMVFSVTAYSASAVAVKRIGADIPALATTIGGLMVTVPLLVSVYILTGEPLPAVVPHRAMLSIIYLGMIGSVLGFALYDYALRHGEATRVALITLITPVLALMLGHLFNGEALQIEAMLGTAAILSGLLLFEYGQAAGQWVRDTLMG